MVRIERGRIVSIDAHTANRATPGGVCLKGLAYAERAHSRDRLLYPVKRNTKGSFKRISWEEALDEIAGKLEYLKQNHGPQSILFYAASGMAGLVNDFSKGFWKLFGGATITYGNLCWPAGLEAVRLTLGENRHNAPWDIENAGLIILWGKNPAETNIHQMVFIEKAQAKGANLVVIDPRRTPSSERADMLLQPKPGTDAALALALCNLLIIHEKTDTDFIREHVLGFDEFRESVAHCTVEWASDITGIRKELIMKLFSYIAGAKTMTLTPGYGMQRFTNGGQTIRSLLALNILTGNIGKPGACFHYADLQSYVFDEVKEPESYYPEIGPDPVFRRSISMARLGEDITNARDPEIKMIWVERGNPVSQNPDTNAVLNAFRKMEFRVVVDQFMTDTAREADIVLPAKNMFEQSDIIGSYWNPYVQLKPMLLQPAGEVKAETEIYYLLAERLGFEDERIARFLPLPGNENIEKFLKDKVEPFDSLSWEQLLERPVIAPGYREIAFEDLVFNTPSGKIELLSEQAAQLWGVNPLPDYRPPEEGHNTGNGTYKLHLLSPNTKNRIHSQFGNLELIRELDDRPSLVMNASDALERGISEGDKVRVFNERGELTTVARLNLSLRKGCVVYHNGWWLQEGGTPNLLSKGRETDMGHGTAFHDCLVEVEVEREGE